MNKARNFLGLRLPQGRRLAALLEASAAPLGALDRDGHHLREMIAREARAEPLLAARDRARAAGDLYWALLCGRRLWSLTEDPAIRLEHLGTLIWSDHFAEADGLLKTVARDATTAAGLDIAAIEVDCALGRFDRVPDRLTALRAHDPAEALRLHLVFAEKLLAYGEYEEARAQADLARALFPGATGPVVLRLRAVLALDGPDTALAALEKRHDLIAPGTETETALRAQFLSEAGRHGEALDILLATLDTNPRAAALYPLASGAAQQCDRVRDLGALLVTACQSCPDVPQIQEALCAYAIDQNETELADALLDDIRQRSFWGYRGLVLSAACQQSDPAEADRCFDTLAKDDLAFSGPRVMYAIYQYYFRAGKGGIARADRIVRDLLPMSMNDTGMLSLHLRLLIARDRDDEAEQVYGALPAGLRLVASIAPFGAYFDARRGRNEAARAAWPGILARSASPVLNARSAYPEEVELRFNGKPGQVLLFLTVFNGMEFTDWFLDYYRKLGVDHFFIIDNGSDDGTFERLQPEQDVSLFSQPGSFSASACGVYWVNHLMRRFGVGHWCFHVDMDEAFIFPHCDQGRSLSDLLAYLDENGYGTIPSFMLDIFPDTLDHTGDADPFAASRYIDTDYAFVRNELPPYRYIQGGVRARLTGRSLLMTKAPLVKMAPDVAFISNNHQHTHLPVADITGAVLHYKFIGNVRGRIQEAIERGEHFLGARFYKALQKGIGDQQAAGGLRGPESTDYRGTRQLIDLGLLQTSTAWEENANNAKNRR